MRVLNLVFIWGNPQNTRIFQSIGRQHLKKMMRHISTIGNECKGQNQEVARENVIRKTWKLGKKARELK